MFRFTFCFHAWIYFASGTRRRRARKPPLFSVYLPRPLSLYSERAYLVNSFSLDPADAVASPRYVSFATAVSSSWHPLGCRRARLTRSHALSSLSRRSDAKRCPLRSRSWPTYLAFDRPARSCNRRFPFRRSPTSASPFRGERRLSPAEHNFAISSLGRRTAGGPLGILPNIYAAQRARPFAFH